MIIYSGIVILDCHLVITILAIFAIYTLVAGAKKKKGRKERKKTYSFLLLEFVTCNLSILLL
jgi:hypothetical protein